MKGNFLFGPAVRWPAPRALNFACLISLPELFVRGLGRLQSGARRALGGPGGFEGSGNRLKEGAFQSVP